MPLVVAALIALLRQAQGYAGSQLHQQLQQTVQALEPLTQLDAGSRAAAAVQLRGVSGALQGAAVLFTELARAAAATSHALEGNTLALAANGAAVINGAGGPAPAFLRPLVARMPAPPRRPAASPSPDFAACPALPCPAPPSPPGAWRLAPALPCPSPPL
jgi:hypothetical protein